MDENKGKNLVPEGTGSETYNRMVVFVSGAGFTGLNAKRPIVAHHKRSNS